jgi:nicotinamidase-related amidase
MPGSVIDLGCVGLALLIIDMQEALVPVIWRGDELTDRIAALAQKARDRRVPVIATQQTGPAGTPLDQDQPGWQLSARLGMQPTDLRLRKTATDSFFSTDLADLLAARDVHTVVITGVATDYCVDATAQSALSHGLDVILVSDGHAPAARGNPEAGLTPEQIVDQYNWVLSHAVHPGGELTLGTAAEIFSDR